MKKLIYLFLLVFSFTFSQDYNDACVLCAEVDGYYCGDDESNWTQYSPNGCVINSWLNDGWEDCVDASDENGAVPTTIGDCQLETVECDTVYVEIPEYIYQTDTVEVEVPFYIYETIIQLDTIVETEYITQIVVDTVEVETFVPEYIYIIDTLWLEGATDTLFVDVIQEVEVIVFDTVIETEYVEIVVVDTVLEYIEIINTEYVDCDTGLPCNSGIMEIIKESEDSNLLYNLQGQVIRKPEGLYIENGKVKWHK
jgi:hypothetical protein